MRHIKVLCLGDSLTEAYGVPSDKGWVYLLGQALHTNIINAGISGDTTTGMLGRCEALLKEHQPTHIIVMGGTNDMLFGLKNELMISNIHAMSRYARHYKVACIIGIPTAIINANELNFLNENVPKRITAYQKALIQYCKDDQRAYINFPKAIGMEHYLDDGIHLNVSGHKQMAHTASAFLSQLIN